MTRKRILRAILPAAVSAVALGLIGLLGMVAGMPWLFPSLGPIIAIQTGSPELPSARPWNVGAGHVIGLASGLAAVQLTGAADAPPVLSAHVLSEPRVAAAVLAVLFLMSTQHMLKAKHPPAETTALLFALGAFEPAFHNVANVGIGVALVALLGEEGRRFCLSN